LATIRLSSHASKALEKLARSDRRLYERVEQSLNRLQEEPSAGKPLQGPLAGRRSLRVGEVRIIYHLEAGQLVVVVLDIARRDKVYRDLE
jgi:mRNA-degrading endonuclease RelE of RelBE toxin-antitoxin system